MSTATVEDEVGEESEQEEDPPVELVQEHDAEPGASSVMRVASSSDKGLLDTVTLSEPSSRAIQNEVAAHPHRCPSLDEEHSASWLSSGVWPLW